MSNRRPRKSRTNSQPPPRVKLFVSFRTSKTPAIQIVRSDLVDFYTSGIARDVTTATPISDIIDFIEEYVAENSADERHFLHNQELNLTAHAHCIYGREKKLKKGVPQQAKETKLIPVESDSEWELLCKRSDTGKTKSGNTFYLVNLTARLTKKPHISLKKRRAPAMTASRKTTSKKKKEVHHLPRKLEIEFFAPLKRDESSEKVQPCGTSRKTISFDIASFIYSAKDSNLGVLSNSSEEASSDDQSDSENDNDNDNEKFSVAFRLSDFRKDVMKQAIEVFSEEYGENKKALGTKSCLYVQENWNVHAWTAVNTTSDLHEILKKESMKNSRMNKKKTLKIRFSFGHKKRDDEFVDAGYFEEDEDDQGFIWSQNPDHHASPVKKLSGKSIREGGWNKIDSIAKLLARMYSNRESCLYEGFSDTHNAIFSRILIGVVSDLERRSATPDSSPLLKAVHSTTEILNAEDCTTYFLSAYNNSTSMKNSTHNNAPMKNEYPPSSQNELEHCAPTLRSWMQAKRESQSFLYVPPQQHQHRQPTVSPVPGMEQHPLGGRTVAQPTALSYAANTGQIHNVTFELDGRKCTIMLEDKLDVNSSILTVLEQGEDVEEMIGWDRDARYKFILPLSIGNEKLYFGSSFVNKTVGDVRNLENVKIPLYIKLEEMN